MSDQYKIKRFAPYTLCLIKDLGSDAEFSGRLAQMGILPGTRVKIVRNSPLGDPVELRTDEGQAVAIRKEDLQKLECEVLAFPLTALPENFKESLEVADMAGGWVFQKKMEERGIKKGSTLIVKERMPLRVNLESTGKSVMLGRGEASKLIVKTRENTGG